MPVNDQLAFDAMKYVVSTSLGTTIGNLRAQATWNHTPSYKRSTNPAGQSRVASFNVVNLYFQYDFAGEGRGKDLALSLNVKNAFDEKPSVFLDAGQPGYSPTNGQGFILAFWKDDCLNRITPALVSDYLRTNIRDNEGDGRSRSTIRRELSDLRAAVNHAIREHIVRPIVFPRLPRDGAPRTRWLTRDEFELMFAEAAKEYRTAEPLQRFLMIAYYTVARSGAVIDLRWDDIDYEKNLIDFNIPDNGGVEVKRKPRAVTPMAPPLRHYLLQRLETYDEVPEYVFHQKRDISRRVKSVAKGFRATAERLGLEDVSPHTLRHTRVSELRNMGMHSHQVAAFLAMSEQTQNRVYTHASKEDLQTMAALIS